MPTDGFRQFTSLFRKNVLVKSRRPCATFFEMALPLVLFALLVYVRSVYEPVTVGPNYYRNNLLTPIGSSFMGEALDSKALTDNNASRRQWEDTQRNPFPQESILMQVAEDALCSDSLAGPAADALEVVLALPAGEADLAQALLRLDPVAAADDATSFLDEARRFAQSGELARNSNQLRADFFDANLDVTVTQVAQRLQSEIDQLNPLLSDPDGAAKAGFTCAEVIFCEIFPKLADERRSGGDSLNDIAQNVTQDFPNVTGALAQFLGNLTQAVYSPVQLYALSRLGLDPTTALPILAGLGLSGANLGPGLGIEYGGWAVLGGLGFAHELRGEGLGLRGQGPNFVGKAWNAVCSRLPMQTAVTREIFEALKASNFASVPPDMHRFLSDVMGMFSSTYNEEAFGEMRGMESRENKAHAMPNADIWQSASHSGVRGRFGHREVAVDDSQEDPRLPESLYHTKGLAPTMENMFVVNCFLCFKLLRHTMQCSKRVAESCSHDPAPVWGCDVGGGFECFGKAKWKSLASQKLTQSALLTGIANASLEEIETEIIPGDPAITSFGDLIALTHEPIVLQTYASEVIEWYPCNVDVVLDQIWESHRAILIAMSILPDCGAGLRRRQGFCA
ncbi:unnamed protein product [Symbiodinium sp. CCMP2592]|nr:unnamed protein product [Symbiodinium sp. CCMP2592]